MEQASKKYKMPNFIGLFVSNESDSKKTIDRFLIEKLLFLQQEYSNISENITDINELNKNYKFPNSLHVTSLYIGGNKEKLRSDFYTSFQEGVESDILIEGLVYVPGKLITGIVIVSEELKIENEFPHITLKIGSWDPKNSNDVLKAIFETSSSPLYGKYKKLFKEEASIYKISGLQINRGKKIEKIDELYVLKMSEKIRLSGITKCHF